MADNFATETVQLTETNVLSGTVDPTAGGGVVAPVGSLYLRNTTPAENWIKTAAGDTAWTQITTGGAGGGLVLVEAQTIVGAATSGFTFAGLDGDADGVYELWWYMVRNAQPFAIQIRPNGLTADREGIITDYPGTGGTVQTANDRFETTLGMQRTDAWGQIRVWGDRNSDQLVRGGSSQAGEHQLTAGGNMRRWMASDYWNDDTTNITSLELVGVLNTGVVVSNCFAAGSQATLWKRPF